VIPEDCEHIRRLIQSIESESSFQASAPTEDDIIRQYNPYLESPGRRPKFQWHY